MNRAAPPQVPWLNYHHLLYFWTVANEGSIARASKALRLAPATISAQLKSLEGQLGEKLFAREGRHLKLTDVGRIVAGYAEQIFTLGREMQDVVGRGGAAPLRLRVGISDVVPKLVAYRLLSPAVGEGSGVSLTCTEDRTERLLAELARHELDLVLADEPVSSGSPVRAFNHLLGECGVSFFAAPALMPSLAPPSGSAFPRCLDGVPMLAPTAGALRRDIERFFDGAGVRPKIVAEFEDSALMKVFGEQGHGAFPGPTVIEEQICDRYGVAVVGRTEAVRERYYAITVERRIKHPTVQAIHTAAKERLFGGR